MSEMFTVTKGTRRGNLIRLTRVTAWHQTFHSGAGASWDTAALAPDAPEKAGAHEGEAGRDGTLGSYADRATFPASEDRGTAVKSLPNTKHDLSQAPKCQAPPASHRCRK